MLYILQFRQNSTLKTQHHLTESEHRFHRTFKNMCDVTSTRKNNTEEKAETKTETENDCESVKLSKDKEHVPVAVKR